LLRQRSNKKRDPKTTSSGLWPPSPKEKDSTDPGIYFPGWLLGELLRYRSELQLFLILILVR